MLDIRLNTKADLSRFLLLCLSFYLISISDAESQFVLEILDNQLEITIPPSYERGDYDSDRMATPFWLLGERRTQDETHPNHSMATRDSEKRTPQAEQAVFYIKAAKISPFAGDLTFDNSPEGLHELICREFQGRWGTEFGFTYFDKRTEIGQCGNYAGAFVAVYSYKVADYLIIIEAIDFVEMMKLEDNRTPPSRAHRIGKVESGKEGGKCH